MKQITIKSYESKKNIVPMIIFLILGILLLVNPGNIVEFISYIFGGAFLVLGVAKFLFDKKRIDSTSGDNFYSIIMIVLGLIFIVFSGTIEFIIRLAIGFWIIVNALNTITIGVNLMRVDKKSIITLIIGFILLIMGIYTIFVSNLVLSTLGLVITIYSVLELINYFYLIIKNR